MSVLQELGARLRAASDELPDGLVLVALEKLRSATELLNWVREESHQEIGVPQLGGATEHAERAAAALRLAEDAIEAYLAVLGLGGEPGARRGQEWREAMRPEEPRPPAAEPDAPPAEPEKLGPWWQERIAQLTGESAAKDQKRIEGTNSADLLRRVAAGVRSGDRARLGRELHGVTASTGLGLSAVTAPVLHRLAADLLGHEPRPEDVPRLRTAAEGRVRALLPGTSPSVLESLLDRICRVPPRGGQRPPGHPADNAVTASVLTGVLLARLGRDAEALDPNAPEPLRPHGDAGEARS
ncbi:hypothetical protein ACWT_5155 [Actinoplanes sp. SE50]|uniref:hypothetical protein n=1 Tax=unclassified Actinoplanes TaxID=2626549 RepID=UPI00023ED49D|nr:MULTISPECIES: hypothetical protein [unclassified Actinoplanes]AEV86172.1 hypothetical protein ACPL_5285 [Actinoplanes sp. SE50/110]ATO84570.1 hypothetical protein ACWT_5155 [Actinoplanes sp. SE50]SLM01980.1 hypothetical protein ACSP50_5218 [Actinoplanes sp. SE50/110]